VPHAYRDVPFCTVVLLCIAALGLEPPRDSGPQYLTDFTTDLYFCGPAGTGKKIKTLERDLYLKYAISILMRMVLFCLSKRTPLLNGLGFSGTSYYSCSLA
jgi:hypothetical protein